MEASGRCIMEFQVSNHCYVCQDPSGLRVGLSLCAHDLQIEDFLQKTGIKLPQEESHLELFLCFDCIDGFLNIQAAFRDCVEIGIAEQLQVSVKPTERTFCFEPVTVIEFVNEVEEPEPVTKVVEPAECTSESTQTADDITGDFDLNQLGDFEEYLMLPSLELLESSQLLLEKVPVTNPNRFKKGAVPITKSLKRLKTKCKHCAKKFDSKRLLKTHIELIHQKHLEKGLRKPKHSSKGSKDKVVNKIQKRMCLSAIQDTIQKCLSQSNPSKLLLPCTVCHKSFQSKQGLASHKRTHKSVSAIGSAGPSSVV